MKGIGDYSSAVARLRPGTRVAIEGPYGAFTTHARRRAKVALIAGGIGVTAIRSLLEDLPRDCDPVVILRASSAEELALASEVAELVRHRKGRVHELVGSRSEVRIDRLSELVPDLREPGRLRVGTRGIRRSGRLDRLAARGPEGLRPLRGLLPVNAHDRPARGHATTTKELHKMRRAPAVVIASAAGFAGIVAMHAGSAPPLLSGTGPSAPVSSSPTTTSPSTTPPVVPTGAARTAVGTSENYGYGVLAVKVTVRGSRITDVSVATTPDRRAVLAAARSTGHPAAAQRGPLCPERPHQRDLGCHLHERGLRLLRPVGARPLGVK